jgi:two-component system, NtrC family, nitrogen regulation sensor histidine kinase NtrY
MAFRSFRVEVAIRVALIAANACVFSFLLVETSYPLTTGLAGFFFLIQCRFLVARVDRSAAALGHFFHAIRNADFTQNYAFPGGKPFDRLRAEYEGVMELLRNYSLGKEKDYHYIRTIAGNIDVGIIVFDQEGTVDLCNEACARLLGMRAIRNVKELAGVDRDLFRLLMEMRNGERESYSISSERDRLRLIVSVNDFVLLRGKYRLVTLQDIQKELDENEIDAWQKMARVLTHEIMNSITPISSLASTTGSILEGLFGDAGSAGDPSSAAGRGAQALEAERDALAAVHSIEKRSRSLLYFVESYRQFLTLPKPVPTLVSCREMLGRLRSLMGGALAAKRIELRCSVVPPDLELEADNVLLEQLLINLVKNSIEALEGTKKPLLEICAYKDERGSACVEVADNGKGIARELIDKVFIPFFTTKDGGSGIGLSLCRQIMRMHDGSIDVASIPGERTVFRLAF